MPCGGNGENRSMRFISALILFVVLTAHGVPAGAQGPLAVYPTLPVGYSSVKIFDRHGSFVGRLLPEKRYWVSIDRIPLFLQNAVIAVEDSRFYEHGGIDVRGIARAAVRNVVKRRLAEGGSTITQQLIKNKHLSSEKSLDRKVNEALLAMEYEKKYSKKQILEMYFNEIYYGNGAWGIAQAARLYFDKSPESLTEAESLLLAGIPKNPGRFNPLGKPADVSGRRAIVLKRMQELGMITALQHKRLSPQTVSTVPSNKAHYYLAHIRALLLERFGSGIIEYGGIEVTAAMDLGLQLSAEKALRAGAQKISPQMQGALVTVDPVTGDLLAMVGGIDFHKAPFNRAVTAKRQPGSAIKPLVYAAAIEQGFSAATLWSDTPVAYQQSGDKPWIPQNYDNKDHGEMSLRQALVQSSNVIAVKLLQSIGTEAFAEQAAKMGIALRNRTDLSVALGTEDLSLHDLTLAYTPLANGGMLPAPRTILRSYDNYRKVWSENPPASTPALSPATAFIVTSMLKDVLITGTAKSLKKFSQEHPAAGKTGTTSDYRDAWFIGYTPRMVTGIWIGHDQPRSGGRGFTGGAIAAPIWETFMRQALAAGPSTDFAQPDSVVTIAVDPGTGHPATQDCPERRDEFFVLEHEPLEYCPKHGGGNRLPLIDLPKLFEPISTQREGQ